MPGLEIVEDETGVRDEFSAAGHRGLHVLARPQTLGAFLHGAVERRRHQPFLRRQIDIPRRHREAIALTHGSRANHLDAEVEVEGHPRHDPQLLEILFPKNCEVRPALREQLADHGGDSAEKMRPKAILQTCRCRPFGRYPGGKAVRVHGLDVRIPDQVDLLGGELGDISFPGSRVGTEILGWRELGGIDEDRDDNLCGATFCQPNQRHVAVMEGSHGWHQRDGRPFQAQAIERAPQCRDRADDHGAS